MTADGSRGEFGLYIHWPFCEAICPYCNFNRVAASAPDNDLWRRSYLQAMLRYRQETNYSFCSSIYFGGGTPSLMDPRTVAALIEAVDASWGLASDAEITLEANPSSAELERFSGYASAGVNRLSIGIQSLREPALKQLGRLHSVSEARSAFEFATQTFGNVSIDLIYGRPHQLVDDWQDELAEACRWGAEHLSLYQLTVEPGTAFGRLLEAGRLPGLPDEHLAAEFLVATNELCASMGYARYEVSNFARPGRQGRHNLNYWRSGDFLGLGPGAHGRITIETERFATETETSPEAWLSAVARGGSGENSRTCLSLVEQAEEYLMMSLRTAEGTDLVRYEQLTGRPPDPRTLSTLQDDGFVTVAEGRLTTTDAGLLVLNRLTAELIA